MNKKLILSMSVLLCIGITSQSQAKISCVFSNQGKTLTVTGSGNDTFNYHSCYDDTSQSTDEWKFSSDWRSNITSAIVGQGVNILGSAAFEYASNLRDLTLSEEIGSIGYGAFMYTSSLNNIIIPANVSSMAVHAFAFRDIKNLKLTIPDSWGDYAMKGQLNVEQTTFPASAEIYCQGELKKCQEALANFFTKDNCPLEQKTKCNCTVNCIKPNKLKEIDENNRDKCTGMYVWDKDRCRRMGEEECNKISKYYYTGSICKTRPADLSKMECVDGYAKLKGYCVDPLKTFAKKRYTPAEAAQWLNEDNNTVTLTFKK